MEEKDTKSELSLGQKMMNVISSISVEPVMLLDGLAYANMIVLMETLQMDKICLNKLQYPAEICSNLSSYGNETDHQQKEASIFLMYNSFVMAFIPLFFILFMGAWSDKYGRKVPLCAAIFGHCILSAGYLINSYFMHWPVEYLLMVTLLDSLGGGAVSFLTAANSYISDVTSEKNRTSRIGLANSIWFLGGPLGTLLGTYVYKTGGYQVLFGTSLVMYTSALMYIVILLPESHGPFANISKLNKLRGTKPSLKLKNSILRVYGFSIKKKERTLSEVTRNTENITIKNMVADFFNPARIIDSFRSTFKKREGNVRLYIILLILANLLRKIGRSAYMYNFTIVVLNWGPSDYGIWVTYKNLVAKIGSLVAVPVLSSLLKVSDSGLAMVGSLSAVADYLLYGFVSTSTEFFIWLAPAAAVLVNSGTIAIRALLSKFVAVDELGKVSAVLGAMDGVMPMISAPLYTAVFHSTSDSLPGAQFFFGVGVNCLMAFIFLFIILTDKTKMYDIVTAKCSPPKGPVQEKNLVIRSDSRFIYDEDNKQHRIATVLLASLNFSIETPQIERQISTQSQQARWESNPMGRITEEGGEENEVEMGGPAENKNVGLDNPVFAEN